MSRKGNKPLVIPQGVAIEIKANLVDIKGPNGHLTVQYPANLIKVANVDNHIKVSRTNDLKQTRMYHGTINANIHNAIVGVSKGFKKILKIVGVGYRASLVNNKLQLAIGFSYPVIFDIPQGLKVECISTTEIHISGPDKIVVGEFSAKVRITRKPEPYKGKGIMYNNEHIIRKVGKTADSGSKKK